MNFNDLTVFIVNKAIFLEIIIILFSFSVDPDITVTYTFWSVVIGGWFSWLSIYGTNQAMVQRYISAKNESTAIW